ncbi:alpha/beta fold hydrolase [Planctomonas deserti]|uniref:alpha/beta fold hydrolase n=1 Tax=Planctomonas deserti TaxID=2144185 RepID=UPI000D3A1FD1|nr:alpha/beta hydrolase [Planctomonas deserti]
MTETLIAPELPRVDGMRHRMLDLPGLRMHVAEAGTGEPVLLLHGFPQHWWEWRDVAPRLAERHRVICPDLRGAGWTDAPRRGYSRRNLTSDLVALLDALGIDRVRLLSHDVGSILAFALCMEHPDRVVSHVALSVPPPVSTVSASMIPAMRHLWFQEALAMPGLGPRLLGSRRARLPRYLFSHFTASPLDPAAIEVFIRPLRQREIARAGSATCRHLVLPELGRLMTGRYRRVGLRTPTLILFGTGETALTPDIVRASMRNVDAYADDIRLEFIDGPGHFLADEAPDEVAHGALRFFAEH